MVTKLLGSWGNYPYFPQSPQTLYWQQEVQPLLRACATNGQTTLAFGKGRSYGDVCLAASDDVLHTTGLDRWIAVDWQQGILVAEAGITLADVIALAVPHGWFLPVTPGTQWVTLGGALANDVHGKNHHQQGTFGCHVRRFALQRSDQDDAIICSHDTHPELFAATIGGLGLTGIITWVELQLSPVQSAWIDMRQIQFGGLEEFFAVCAEWDAQSTYSVAWVDCTAQGADLGRGVYFCGNHATSGGYTVPARHHYTVPFTLPLSPLTSTVLKIFNACYYRRHPTRLTPQRIDLQRFFYPLDRIGAWNRLYGRRGFQQYQCVIPEHNAQAASQELLRVIARSGRGSFLAVLKRFGARRSPGLLSFPLPGVSLALDFAESGTENARLFAELDAILRAAGGRLYPAKDAQMSAADFQRAYPTWETLERLRDPVLLSRFWQRVTRL